MGMEPDEKRPKTEKNELSSPESHTREKFNALPVEKKIALRAKFESTIGLAAEQNNHAAILAFVHVGGDINASLDYVQRTSPPLFFQTNFYFHPNETLLNIAIRTRSYETVRQILRLGGTPRYHDIACAFFTNSRPIIELLLTYDAPIHADDTRMDKDLFLHIAIRKNWHTITQKLVAQGVDVNTCNEDELNNTPLIYAAQNNSQENCQLLLEHNAQIDMQNTEGWTPLWYAATNGSFSLVKFLLEHGANPNILDCDQSPLLQNVICDLDDEDQAYQIAQILLHHNADPNKQDYDGNTPLMVAALNNCYQIVELLLQYGANPTLKDSEGNTALNNAQNEFVHHFGDQENETFFNNEQYHSLRSIQRVLSDPEAKQNVITRRENNPAVENDFKKFHACFGGKNTCVALFNREMGFK